MTRHEQYGRSFEIHENENKLITRYKKYFNRQRWNFDPKKSENFSKIEILRYFLKLGNFLIFLLRDYNVDDFDIIFAFRNSRVWCCTVYK